MYRYIMNEMKFGPLQLGGKVDVLGSREYTLYVAHSPRNTIGEGMQVF